LVRQASKHGKMFHFSPKKVGKMFHFSPKKVGKMFQNGPILIGKNAKSNYNTLIDKE
jgi:hypothetical protein